VTVLKGNYTSALKHHNRVQNLHFRIFHAFQLVLKTWRGIDQYIQASLEYRLSHNTESNTCCALADVRRAATDALYSVQPSPALLQSACQFWQFQQTPFEQMPAQQIPSEQMPAQQIPSEQMPAQQAPSDHMPAQQSSPESHELPQPGSTQQQAQSQQTLDSAATQSNSAYFPLPPLPESGISALRQQARLTSLHLGEEEGLPSFSSQEEEEQEDEGQAGGAAGKASAEVIQIPVELQVIAMMLPCSCVDRLQYWL